MGRKAQLSREEFDKLKATINDIPRKDKEPLSKYADTLSYYSGIRLISPKTLSRVLRSETYEDYKELLKKENKKKEKEAVEEIKLPEDMSLMDIYTMLVSFDRRLATIEAKLNQSEVKILAVVNEDKLTRWDTLHKEIQENKKAEVLNQ